MRRRLGALGSALVLLAISVPATAEVAPLGTELFETDVDHPGPRASRQIDDRDAARLLADLRFGSDPLRLVVDADLVRRFSSSPDVFEVWLCHNPGVELGFDHQYALDVLDTSIAEYFDWLSGGRYRPTFVEGGTVVVDEQINGVNPYPCIPGVKAGSLGTANAAFIVVQEGSPLASGRARMPPACFGAACPTLFPASDRWAAVGDGAIVRWSQFLPLPSLSTAAHEIGHTHHWPHSYTGMSASEYDYPLDVMSGNRLPGDVPALVPLATPVFNRYRAGWVDPADVVVFEGGVIDVTLAPAGVTGTQMVVLPLRSEEGSFLTLGARVGSVHDPIPPEWEGVDVHWVSQVCGGYPCGGLSSYLGPFPGEPYQVVNVVGVGGSVDYTGVGEELAAGSLRVEVLDQTEGGFAVRLVGFGDVTTTIFRDDIFWLAVEGITRGCGSRGFCPGDGVTRGQMAAFLVRALGLTDPGEVDFVDDDESIFEADIEKLATAGITRGCNPPANDRFCPDRVVTRGEMAAFLVRALGLTDPGEVDFVDDDESIFEADIEKLAAAGITRGCNPPDNDRFCPASQVTRGQMAAFLRRALG